MSYNTRLTFCSVTVLSLFLLLLPTCMFLFLDNFPLRHQPSRLQEDYKFYGVFDGHCGTRAAKFASRALHLNLELFLNAQEAPPRPPSPPPTTTPLGPSSPANNNASIERAVREAFRKTQRDFLDSVQPSPPLSPSGDDGYPDRDVAGRSEAGAGAGAGAEDDSGTTATVALVYADVTVVAHVGDSRAVLCCDGEGRAVEITEGGWMGGWVGAAAAALVVL